jgi:hypothetical protein
MEDVWMTAFGHRSLNLVEVSPNKEKTPTFLVLWSIGGDTVPLRGPSTHEGRYSLLGSTTSIKPVNFWGDCMMRSPLRLTVTKTFVMYSDMQK